MSIRLRRLRIPRRLWIRPSPRRRARYTSELTRPTFAFSRRTMVLRQIGGKWLIVHLHACNMVVASTEQSPPK
jgi:hypothetical protein